MRVVAPRRPLRRHPVGKGHQRIDRKLDRAARDEIGKMRRLAAARCRARRSQGCQTQPAGDERLLAGAPRQQEMQPPRSFRARRRSGRPVAAASRPGTAATCAWRARRSRSAASTRPPGKTSAPAKTVGLVAPQHQHFEPVPARRAGARASPQAIGRRSAHRPAPQILKESKVSGANSSSGLRRRGDRPCSW